MRILNGIMAAYVLFWTMAFVGSCRAEEAKDAANVADVEETSSDTLKIDEAVLENGLRIIAVHTNIKNVVTGGIGYFVGSGDDPRNVVGISHVLEHLMFKGTKNLDGKKLKEIIFTYNKDSNAFTSYDVTFYMHTCKKEFLDLDLKIEADRMQNLALREEDIKKELGVVIEERKMRTESDPRINYMEESAWKAMYLFSNYSYPVIGYLDQIEACTKEEIQKHYKKHYIPPNAFILLVGDITLEEAVTLVKKHFGAIPRGTKVERKRVIDPTDVSIRYTMDHDSKQITVHNLNMAYKIERSLISNLRKLKIVELAAGILAIGQGSVLYQNLVDKEELAYVVGSYVDVRAFDKARLSISTVFRENKKMEDVKNKMTEIIHNFSRTYLTAELLENEKRKMLDELEISNDNPQRLFMIILDPIVNGYSTAELREMKSIIKGIKLEEVLAVANQIFIAENRIMSIYSHPPSVGS
ncbi:MAG: insulinase family protein [Holosporales bacterium]|jgi:zinc protease|nr:insulinase family protein [Holosporales bacterium]